MNVFREKRHLLKHGPALKLENFDCQLRGAKFKDREKFQGVSLMSLRTLKDLALATNRPRSLYSCCVVTILLTTPIQSTRQPSLLRTTYRSLQLPSRIVSSSTYNNLLLPHVANTAFTRLCTEPGKRDCFGLVSNRIENSRERENE